MECSLDRNKISSAISQKVKQMVDDSNSFKLENDYYVSIEGSNWEEKVKEINNLFKDEVFKRYPTDVFRINVSPELIRMYIFSQKDSSEQVQEAIREEYLKQFSEEGVNLLSGDFWLNHPILEDPNVQQLLAFAQKINPNFQIGFLEGMDAKATSLIRDHIILLRESQFIDELPEEVAHFFIALLPEDSELLKGMMSDITNHSIYGETYEKYKNNSAYQIDGRPNIEKIKKEAIGKLISDYIKAAWENTADEKYKSKRGKVREFVDKVMKFLRKAFYTLSGQLYKEPLLSKSNFELGADMIMEGNTSMLDLNKTVSPYDSVFNSLMEENKAETFEGSQMAKALHTFSRSIKSTITKNFFKYIEDNNLEGLQEFLKDPKYKDFNRVWDVIELLSSAEKEFDFMSNKENVDLVYLGEQIGKLKDAYHELEQIPIALDKILDKLKLEKKQNKLSESELINRITEVQHYLQLSKTFENITDQFNSLLAYVHEKEKDNVEQFPYFEKTYEKMIADIGSTSSRFKSADSQIFNILRDYLLDLTHNWTEKLFDEYTKETKDQIAKADIERTKIQLKRHLEEQFTNKEMLRQALNGDFPKLKEIVTKDGQKIKWDKSKLKDISKVDHMIFMFGATSTMSDPFVSNALALYIDKVYAAQTKTTQEQMAFGNKIMPIIADLSKSGLDYYEAQTKILSIQNFFDPLTKDNKFERKTLMSQTLRYEFQYERQLLLNQKTELSKDKYALQQKLSRENITEEEKIATLEEISKLTKEIEDKKNEYNEFIEKYSYRPYTDEFYNVRKFLDSKKGDSEQLSKLKKIEAEIISKRERFDEIVINNISPEDYTSVVEELNKLYDERARLKASLPKLEQDDYKLYEELYEPNEDATEKVVARNKRAFVQRYVNHQRSFNGSTLSDEDLRSMAEDAYENTHKIFTPTEEFWERRKKIIDEINELSGTTNDYTKVLVEQLKDLDDKRRKLLSYVKNFRNEVDMTPLETNTIPNSTEFIHKALAETEDEIKEIRRKIRILASVQENTFTKRETPEQVAKNMTAYIELLHVLQEIVLSKTPTEKITSYLNHYFEANNTISENIKEIIEKALEAKNPDVLKDILNLLVPKGKEGKFVLNLLKNKKLNDLTKLEDDFMDALSSKVRVSKDIYKLIQEKYDELNELGGKELSIDYAIGPLLTISRIVHEIMSTENPTPSILQLQQIVANKQSVPSIYTDISAVEKYLSDGLLDSVVSYLRLKADLNPDDHVSGPLADFLYSIHTASEKNGSIVITPRNYIKNYKPILDENNSPVDKTLFKEHYPRHLSRNKIKDKYINERIDQTDPRVIAGTHEANVDINGEWLPKVDKSSKFYNHEYDKLKNATDEQGKNLFKLLNEYTQFYLNRQKEMIVEGQRLDLVIPAKMFDHFEKTKLHITSMKEWANNFSERINFKKTEESASAENINFNEELGIATKQNREIYAGALIAEHSVKLDSRRKVPVQRVTNDILSSMMFFINDTNQYKAKNYVAPIFKSFADVFHEANLKDPSSNKLRAKIFQEILNGKIYDIKPESFVNSKFVAEFLSVVNKFAVSKLLADPLGAIVNLTSGQLQMLIEANFNKDELAEWGKSGLQASVWSAIYVGDTFTKQVLSKETQISNALGFLPESTDISHRMSGLSIKTDWRKALMFPRSITEVEMGIQLGLSIAHAFDIEHNGKKYKIEDIYQVNPDSGILELIPEFENNKELKEKYDIIDGTVVAKIRRNVVQKYTLIQGNFYKFNQDDISRYALGRSAELMKRWFVSGYIRRFQGRVLDPMLQEERIGFHAAALELLKEVIFGVFKVKGASISSIGDYWRNGLNNKEKRAIRQSLAEVMYIAVAGLSLLLLFGYDSDDKDHNKRLKEMNYWQQIMLLINLRVSSELGTFIPLPVWGLGLNETKRALLDPISTIRGTFDNIISMSALAIYQLEYSLGMDSLKGQLYYQKNQGSKTTGSILFGLLDKEDVYFKDKGDSKFWALLTNTLGYTGYTLKPEPYIKTLTQINNRLK